jgi:hypothetical protein
VTGERKYMKLHSFLPFAAAVGLLLVTSCTAAAEDEASAELPIETNVVDSPYALSKDRLIKMNQRAVAGETITVLGRRLADAPENFQLLDPPWVMVSWKQKGKVPKGLMQALAAHVDSLPKALDEKSVALLTGSFSVNRPELKYQERRKQKLPQFNFTVEKSVVIPLVVTEDAARQTFHREMARIGQVLDLFCAEQDLENRYDPTLTAGGTLSWYENMIAITQLISAKPVFSFKPVPYVIGTVLIDPSTGRSTRIILSRGMHQDPRD